ncbi:MAG: 1-deoxy-D-xylulose-5-phosphate synthase, partial [Vulcanimicrobiota bacterium]
MDEIFSKIQTPRDIKKYSIEQLNQLSGYLRNEIIQTISKTGGHLASSLGVVEITVALHYIFNAPDDKIIWDVGHQCYAHKLLTGRNEKFCTIRQYQGISGFTRSCESCFDPFGAGHSSTSISSALGFAAARDQLKEDYEVIAVIGDGAMTGGLAFEGLNNAGHLKSDLIVVLNDNEMSIAKNVGAISRYLNKIRMEPHYVKFRDEIRHLMEKIPKFGKKMLSTAERIEDSLIYAVIPGVLFEAMGFTYLGPFDGHNMESIIPAFKQAKELNGPRLIHVTTQKGRGFQPAEKDATSWHGAIPFNPENGKVDKSQKQIPQYNEVFCDTLIKLALDDPKIVAITAAMPDGTGLIPFKDEFPER